MRPLSDNRPPNFVDWDHRPAVVGAGGAYAMLKPNTPWVRVNSADVRNSANVLHEHVWRDRFKDKYGELDPPLELANTRQALVSPSQNDGA